MISPVFKSIPELLATKRGFPEPWNEVWSAYKHLQTHDAAIANLSVGAPPGMFAPYDTRFYILETGFAANAYTAALSPVATGLSIPSGWSGLFVFTNPNTGAATMDVGSTDGAVTIKKYASGSKADLASGDIVPGLPTRMTFDGTHWVMQFIPAPVSLAGYATEAYADAAAAAIARVRFTAITASATHNYDAAAAYAWVELDGGGGGGGKPGSGGVVGIPGAGGGSCAKLIDLSAVSSATFVIGAGGAGGTSTNGGNGGTSSYSDGTNTMTANGGAGGAGHSTNGAEGSSIGGSASGGDINFTGSNGVHKHTRFCGAGAAYGSNAAPGYGAGTQPGAGGGTNYTTGNGYAGFRGEGRVWEFF